MAISITLIRHGETDANAAGRWQGQTDSPLSALGRAQVAELAARLGRRRFDLVVSSDLGRARATASACADQVEVDAGFREIDVGAWEGLSREETAQRFAQNTRDLLEGRPVPIGGGESWPDLEARVDNAFLRLRLRLRDGGSAVVFSHGAALTALLTGFLGLRGLPRRPLGKLVNTSVTELRLDGDRVELTTFNDATHLAEPLGWSTEPRARGQAAVALVSLDAGAHGTLTPLESWYPQPTAVYSAAPGLEACRALAASLGVDEEAPLPLHLSSGFEAWAGSHGGQHVVIATDSAFVATHARAALQLTGRAPSVTFARPRCASITHLLVGHDDVRLQDFNVGR